MSRLKYKSFPKKLHLIITGEEGKGLSLVIKRETLSRIITVTLLLITLLGTGSWLGINFFQQKNALKPQVSELSAELLQLQEDYFGDLTGEIAAREAVLGKQIDTLTAALLHLTDEKKQLISQYEEKLSCNTNDYSARIKNIQAEYEQKLSGISSEWSLEVAELSQAKKAKEELLEKVTGRLDERSRIIESMMDRIGVNVKVDDTGANSGGPFIASNIDEDYSERLLDRSERYIDAIKKMPLGHPISGRVTSNYGYRTDPLNKKKAFHAGIDFKGRIGDKVAATADGTVKKIGYDKGFGHYIYLSHGNQYETVFAHLSKKLVKKGATVKRGQIIGMVGNTGRSTGPHLHYEVRHRGRTVNPWKYLSVAKLSFTVPE